jgi:hypothetical protein
VNCIKKRQNTIGLPAAVQFEYIED